MGQLGCPRTENHAKVLDCRTYLLWKLWWKQPDDKTHPAKNKSQIITVNSLQDGHLWDRHQVSVLERCPSYKESNKGNEQRQGPTLGVRFTEVSVKRESTVFTLNQGWFACNCYNKKLKHGRRWWQREPQKSNRLRLAKQHLCTGIAIFCRFLSRRCTTTTWKSLISRFVEDGNTRQQLSSSFPELWNSPFWIKVQIKLRTFDELNEME